MRAIGTIQNEQDSRRLAAYLLTLGISSHLEATSQGICVWIRDEDLLPRAKQEFAEFVTNPSDPRYDQSLVAAEQIRRDHEKAEQQYRKNVREMRERWRRPVPQSCPFTMALMGICIVVAAVSRLGEDYEPLLNYLFMTELTKEGGMISWDARFLELRNGQVWRLITPILIHFGPIHLLFNMWNFYNLSGAVEIVRGRWRLILLVLFTAVVSNVAQCVYRSPAFGGMSGVLYGLFGYVWMKSRYDPKVGMFLHKDTVTLMIVWLFICMTGRVGPIANAAHVAGLISGVVIGITPVLWRKLMK